MRHFAERDYEIDRAIANYEGLPYFSPRVSGWLREMVDAGKMGWNLKMHGVEDAVKNNLCPMCRNKDGYRERDDSCGGNGTFAGYVTTQASLAGADPAVAIDDYNEMRAHYNLPSVDNPYREDDDDLMDFGDDNEFADVPAPAQAAPAQPGVWDRVKNVVKPAPAPVAPATPSPAWDEFGFGEEDPLDGLR